MRRGGTRRFGSASGLILIFGSIPPNSRFSASGPVAAARAMWRCYCNCTSPFFLRMFGHKLCPPRPSTGVPAHSTSDILHRAIPVGPMAEATSAPTSQGRSTPPVNLAFSTIAPSAPRRVPAVNDGQCAATHLRGRAPRATPESMRFALCEAAPAASHPRLRRRMQRQICNLLTPANSPSLRRAPWYARTNLPQSRPEPNRFVAFNAGISKSLSRTAPFFIEWKTGSP
jgi:hypothetical protein